MLITWINSFKQVNIDLITMNFELKDINQDDLSVNTYKRHIPLPYSRRLQH